MQEDTETIIPDQEYHKLLDEFYQENLDIVSKDEYERAKNDPEYLRELIRNVTDLHQRIGRELLLKDNNCHAWKKQFRRQK